MIELTTAEARVLGVLIEKGFTTPNQYPLSLNAIATGASQLSNRDPVMQMDEDQAFDAVEGLRNKQLTVRVDQVGSRVHKYKHIGVETLHCRQAELAILAELLLRGPQTLGELRSRASRMQPFESLERVTEMLRALMERSDPLVKQLPPSPGSRAERYEQLLCPDVRPVESTAVSAAEKSASPKVASSSLEARVAQLESEVNSLKSAIQSIADQLGIPAPAPSQVAPSEG
jgi:uncharacterized protein YceH (UPF0502 family)